MHAQWASGFDRKGISTVEAAEMLNDADFKAWYFSRIKSMGTMYWDPKQKCTCDRCHEVIVRFEDLRVVLGRRVHPSCFEKDYQDWMEKGKAKGYIDENVKLYFERITNVLGK